ncbi:hypothetical protein [Staphylococcus xylosus]|uniref:hypothetical protein n=1 Tax=Staphylococcus xylosus TaxID=1288 RepID=UPI000D1D190D|nr:hypothetical protein [Staphylococcus xylosus]PTH98315.1 hypothetical protein BU099_08475 [Staphylococcus xylosus]
MIKKIENPSGQKIVALHYESITKLVNYLANSQEKATKAISDYLQKNAGLNKGAADAVAATFVTVIL